MSKKPVVILRAIEAFYWGQRFVNQGDRVLSNDPVVKGREHLFTPDDIEQATAAPGEKRNVTKPKPKGEKK